MVLKYIFGLLLGLLISNAPVEAASLWTVTQANTVFVDGPGDKEKKKDKKDKEEKSKVDKKSYNPDRAARRSAKLAKNSYRTKRNAIAGRAKTRNFFHRTFNSKFGKPVNFRKRRQRNRWKKGR